MKKINERFLNEGEVCVLDLNKVSGYNIVNLEEGAEDEAYVPPVFLVGDASKNLSGKQYFTIIKHLTNGLLLDMLSGEIIHTQFTCGDDLLLTGTYGFRNLPVSERERINSYCKIYEKIREPLDKESFNKTYISLMRSPLSVQPASSPFIELDEDMYKIISSQSTSEVTDFIKQKKIVAQKKLSDSYNKNINWIQNVYSYLESNRIPISETHIHR